MFPLLAQYVTHASFNYYPMCGQIDSVAEGLCDITDAHLDQLLDTVDAMQPDDLIACLDAMAERREEEGGGLPAA